MKGCSSFDFFVLLLQDWKCYCTFLKTFILELQIVYVCQCVCVYIKYLAFSNNLKATHVTLFSIF